MCIRDSLDAIKYGLWERHQISTVNVEDLVNQTLCFGEMVRKFLTYYAQDYARKFDITAHFHEWMASSGLPDLRRDDVRVATVFTTHATMLGRYIASNAVSSTHLAVYKRQYQRFGLSLHCPLERSSA